VFAIVPRRGDRTRMIHIHCGLGRDRFFNRDNVERGVFRAAVDQGGHAVKIHLFVILKGE